MSSPYRHPKTGVYWFRKWVPLALRSRLGKGLHQQSLGTKDVEVARIKFAVVAAEVARRWDALSAEPGRLTRVQRWALAGEFYRHLLAKHRDDPGSPYRWEFEARMDEVKSKPAALRPTTAVVLARSALPAFLAEHGIPVADADLLDLAKDCVEAGAAAKRALARHARGDFRPDPDADRWPEYRPRVSATHPQARESGAAQLTLAGEWDHFVRERGLSPSTQKRWRPLISKLAAHVGRADLATVTPAEVGEWKRVLLDSGLSRKTVRESHIAAARSFFSWAVGSGKLAANPCAGITVAPERAVKITPRRGRDLNDDEAKLILSETLRSADPRTSPAFAAARRWVPWLCAYTAARVNELTQARREDVHRIDVGDVTAWIIRITPEAGSVKDGKIREVPLHPHLVEMGFVRFVLSRPDGPLFYSPERSRGGSAMNPAYKKVGEKLAAWVREIGVDDPGVDPNHGWRHRFKTVARRVGMDVEVREGIAGHAPRTIGEAYGTMPIERIYAEICRLPRYEVLPPTGERPKTKPHSDRNTRRSATAQRAEVTGMG